MSRQPLPVSAARPLASALAVLAIVLAACGPGAPPLTDPREILREGAASLAGMTSFHLRGAIEGEVALDVGGAGGGGVPLPLDGTTIDADVDVANGELAVELLSPSLLNLRVNLVVVDGSAYLRVPIVTGDAWFRQPAEGGVGGDPGAAVAGLGAYLAADGRSPERLPDARCTGTECYRVRFVVPAGELAAALGTLGGTVPGLSGDAADTVIVTAGIRKDNLRLATLGLELPTGGAAPLEIDLELSRVNEPVTITAPPADEVRDAPGS